MVADQSRYDAKGSQAGASALIPRDAEKMRVRSRCLLFVNCARINAVIFALTGLIINAKIFALESENPKTMTEDSGLRRRTGGRSARVLDAVANAVIQELSESGIENFSIPRAAARAGISNSSMYRRWSNKAALIAFAGGRIARQSIPFPDCGSLREDLIRVLAEVSESFRDPSSRSMIGMAFSSSDSPEVQHTQSTFWKLRVEEQQAMFDRAIARGEIDEATDTGEIVERVIGPLFFRYFMSRRPVTSEFLQNLADSVLANLPVASAQPVKRERARAGIPQRTKVRA